MPRACFLIQMACEIGKTKRKVNEKKFKKR